MGDMLLRVLDLLWSLIAQTAWIWLPAFVGGFVLGYAWRESGEPEARSKNQQSPIEQDVNGVVIDGP